MVSSPELYQPSAASVNWLPVCADAHGLVVNRDLFVQYGIPLPTDYASFVAACKAFEEVGIRGYTADYLYDYTCMETLQGLSAGELTTIAGRKWRTAYSDPANNTRVGLDDTVWPGGFERMEQRAACHVLRLLRRCRDVPRAGY